MFSLKPHQSSTTLVTMLFACVLTVFACGPLFVSAQATSLPNTAPTPTANPTLNNGSVLPPLNLPTVAPTIPQATSPGETGAAEESVKLNLAILDNILYSFFTGIGGSVLWLGGVALDSALGYFVANMKSTLDTLGMDEAINNIWTVVRDIFNLIFIFSLIFIGFRTILDAESSSARKALGYLIAAALLINFSLYFTKVIIDFSNLASFQIYQLINVEGGYESAMFGLVHVKGIAGTFMTYTDLTSYASENTEFMNQLSSGKVINLKFVAFAFIIMIFMLSAGFVFLAGAVILIGRFVALILYMMFSPAMFLGWIYPGFSKYSSKWWSSFLNHAVTAPAYLFMLYLSASTLENVVKRPEYSFRSAIDNDAVASGAFGLIIYYFLVIAFLFGSLVVAKHFGAVGASQAISIAQSARKRLQGMAVGMVGRGAQAVIGGVAGKLGDTMDAHRTATGKPRGEWGRALRSTISGVENAKYGASTSRKDRKDADKKEKSETDKAHRTHMVTTSIKASEPALATKSSDRTEDQRRIIYEMEQKLRGASKDDVIEMAKDKDMQSSLLAAAPSLSSTQIEAILGDNSVSDEFKDKLKKQRADKTATALGIQLDSENVNDFKNINNATKDQLKSLGFGTLLIGSRFLQDSQLKDLGENLTPYQMEILKGKRKQDLKTAGLLPTDAKAILESRKGDAEIAKLPKEFFDGPGVGDALRSTNKITVGLLKKLASENEIDLPGLRYKIEYAYGGMDVLPKSVKEFFDSKDGIPYKG